LLTVGRLAPRVLAVDGAIAIRPTVIVTANVDHREVDGDWAAGLLTAFDRELNHLRRWAQGGSA
jgi:pyruvate/2-oxoglutarate dehydrogenase complex dihydrolipoamide acyltransferase (E2) component